MSRRAVFFDRDGVLNHDLGYVSTIDRFFWINGAIESISYLKVSGSQSPEKVSQAILDQITRS